MTLPYQEQFIFSHFISTKLHKYHFPLLQSFVEQSIMTAEQPQ